MKTSIRIVLVAAFAFAVMLGVSSLFSEAEAGRCLCPKIYGPVKCDNGKTYVNLCEAQCHNAKNCVPTGEI